MLRITKKSVGKNKSWALAGKLVGPWVVELRSIITRETSQKEPFVLDLSEVTFVDGAGLRLLNELAEAGVPLNDCSPFIAELLRMEIGQ